MSIQTPNGFRPVQRIVYNNPVSLNVDILNPALQGLLELLAENSPLLPQDWILEDFLNAGLIVLDQRGRVVSVNESLEAPYLSAIAAKDLPADVTYTLVPSDQIPDRTFRNALSFDHTTQTFGYDLEKARKLHRAKLRMVREHHFNILDGKARRAQRMNDSAALETINTQAQQLADLPQDLRIDGATSHEDLLSIWPAEFGDYPVDTPIDWETQ